MKGVKNSLIKDTPLVASYLFSWSLLLIFLQSSLDSFSKYSLSVSIVQNQHTSSVVANISRLGNVSFFQFEDGSTFDELLAWRIAGQEPSARGHI
jgi:hypothetical protein